jgi:hypothetical protein
MEYEGSIGFFAYFQVLGLCMAKKLDLSENKFPPVTRRCRCKTKFGADLNGSVGSISDLKPKDPGFESRIRQGYICWWRGSKRSGCVMNVSPCGFKMKEFTLKFPKNLITN